MKINRAKKTFPVIFAGAGPGDAELITVKGMNALKKADIVIYAGSLVSKKMLSYCRKKTVIHDSAPMNLEEITSLMVKGARSGRRVVRLHTGDPSLYGALREQARVLEAAEVPYEIIPGVSSAFASAAALKRELTMPGVSQTVIFTRMAGRTPTPDNEKLSLLSMHQATICIFLSAGMIDKTVRELKKGYPPDTPAAVVYRASWKDEAVITGLLKNIAARVKAAGITKQAMIIVGRTLDGAAGECSKLYGAEFSHGFRKK